MTVHEYGCEQPAPPNGSDKGLNHGVSERSCAEKEPEAQNPPRGAKVSEWSPELSAEASAEPVSEGDRVGEYIRAGRQPVGEVSGLVQVP